MMSWKLAVPGRTALLFAVLLLFGACNSTSGAEKRPEAPPSTDSSASSPHDVRHDETRDRASDADDSDATQSAPRRYLALGDSYTIGTRVAPDERFPAQLVDRLEQQDIAIDDPKIVARGGWTTEDLDRGIAAAEIDGQTYDLVTLLIGVNNQFQGWSAPKFRPEFVELLKRSIRFADGDEGRVIVVSIPDYSVTPFGQRADPDQTARELETFNDIVQTEAREAGVHHVEVTDLSRRAADNRELVASDGLHPSGKQYELWVDRIAPVARGVLTAAAANIDASP